MVTTTISLVGYGDYHAFHDYTGAWLMEMLCLIFLMSFGNYSFASITKQVRQYKPVLTPLRLAVQESQNMEHFLFKLNEKIKNHALPQNIIDGAKSHIFENVNSSPTYYFNDNQFYRELPFQLRRELTKRVLY